MGKNRHVKVMRWPFVLKVRRVRCVHQNAPTQHVRLTCLRAQKHVLNVLSRTSQPVINTVLSCASPVVAARQVRNVSTPGVRWWASACTPCPLQDTSHWYSLQTEKTSASEHFQLRCDDL